MNFSYIVDPAVDADVDAAMNADEASRCQAWSKYQLDVLRNYVMLPVASHRGDLFMQAKLSVVFLPGSGQFDTVTLRRTA